MTLYFHQTCRRTRTVPNFDKIFDTKCSKTIRQKFKMNIFSDRVKLVLSESYFSFIFCRLNFENFDKENRYGTDTIRQQIRWNLSPNRVNEVKNDHLIDVTRCNNNCCKKNCI